MEREREREREKGKSEQAAWLDDDDDDDDDDALISLLMCLHREKIYSEYFGCKLFIIQVWSKTTELSFS